MLLSAKRSILLLSGGPDSSRDNPDPEANRAMLISAAARLLVPRVDPDRFDSAEMLAKGRDQLVIAQSGTDALPTKALQRFLVIDCLSESERPSFDRLTAHEIAAVTTEMVIFEWLERADTDDFRALLKLIR